MLRDKRDLVEADLDRFYRRDLRDLWRFDEHGHRRLTLRMVYVRLQHLPPDSALAIDANGGRRPWSMSEHLLADLWVLHGRHYLGKSAPKKFDHPGRPKRIAPAMSPARAARLRQSKRRRAEIHRKRRREED